MATTTNIGATPRQTTGKGGARSVRREGRVPGILYGHGEESIPLSVDARELQRLIHSVSIENTIIDLALKGARQPFKVLIREIQRHPTREEYIHVDFFHVAMDEKISVEVPIVLKGEPAGVRNKGGMLDHQLRDLEVYCLPAEIPEKIEVDVADLDIGDAIHVRDLPVPEGVEIETDPDRAVATVLPPAVTPTEEEEAAAAAEEPVEPEIITKRRVEGEGEEGEERP
jgi:large subunit ribosomal protein L25